MAAALFVLLLWAGSEVAATQQVFLHEATSLEIIAWTQYDSWGPNPQRPPDVKVFDKTTNLRLVQEAQNHLDNQPRGGWGSCGIGSPTYFYLLRFATLGALTQVYSGDLNCALWTVMTLGDISWVITSLVTPGSNLTCRDSVFLPCSGPVFVYSATLDGVEILRALHQQTGLPTAT
jgi:hypothetical protein